MVATTHIFMNFLWSLPQTQKTKEICNHLNKKEKTKIYFLSFMLGIICFGILTVLIFGFALQMMHIAVAGLLLIVLLFSFNAVTYKQKTLLVNTKFAKDKGYSISDL